MNKTAEDLCSYRFRFTFPGESQPRQERCTRAAINGGLCICHWQNAGKSPEKLGLEVRKEFARTDFVNMQGFFFPTGFAFQIPKQVSVPLIMDDCQFGKAVEIHEVVFEKPISFRNLKASSLILTNSVFKEVADFTEIKLGEELKIFVCKFERDATWMGINVENTSTTRAALFESTSFLGNVDLSNAYLPRGAIFNDVKFFDCTKQIDFYLTICSTNGMNFYNCEIIATALFREVDLRKQQILFQACLLDGVVFSHLPLGSLKIENPNRINQATNYGVRGQLVLRDEVLLAQKSGMKKYWLIPSNVIAHYRWFENYFYKRSMFSLAQRCSIGILRCSRFDPNYGRGARIINWFYDKMSHYGYSILRPLGWIAAFVFGLPLLFESFGVEIWDASIVGYWSNVVENLYFLSLSKHVEFSPFPPTFAKLLLLVQSAFVYLSVGFLIVAIRRRFTPKKPIDG